jgi:hypothetical protein
MTYSSNHFLPEFPYNDLVPVKERVALECKHEDGADDYGTSEVVWVDKIQGLGHVMAACSSCGESCEWHVWA